MDRFNLPHALTEMGYKAEVGARGFMLYRRGEFVDGTVTFKTPEMCDRLRFDQNGLTREFTQLCLDTAYAHAGITA